MFKDITPNTFSKLTYPQQLDLVLSQLAGENLILSPQGALSASAELRPELDSIFSTVFARKDRETSKVQVQVRGGFVSPDLERTIFVELIGRDGSKFIPNLAAPRWLDPPLSVLDEKTLGGLLIHKKPGETPRFELLLHPLVVTDCITSTKARQPQVIEMIVGGFAQRNVALEEGDMPTIVKANNDRILHITTAERAGMIYYGRLVKTSPFTLEVQRNLLGIYGEPYPLTKAQNDTAFLSHIRNANQRGMVPGLTDHPKVNERLTQCLKSVIADTVNQEFADSLRINFEAIFFQPETNRMSAVVTMIARNDDDARYCLFVPGRPHALTNEMVGLNFSIGWGTEGVVTPPSQQIVLWQKDLAGAPPEHDLNLEVNNFLLSGSFLVGEFNRLMRDRTSSMFYQKIESLVKKVENDTGMHEVKIFSCPPIVQGPRKVVFPLICQLSKHLLVTEFPYDPVMGFAGFEGRGGISISVCPRAD